MDNVKKHVAILLRSPVFWSMVGYLVGRYTAKGYGRVVGFVLFSVLVLWMTLGVVWGAIKKYGEQEESKR